MLSCALLPKLFSLCLWHQTCMVLLLVLWLLLLSLFLTHCDLQVDLLKPSYHCTIYTRCLNIGTIDILFWIIFAMGTCSVHCKMFSSNHGLSSLDTPVVTIKKVFRHCQTSPNGQNAHNPTSSWEPLPYALSLSNLVHTRGVICDPQPGLLSELQWHDLYISKGLQNQKSKRWCSYHMAALSVSYLLMRHCNLPISTCF